MGVEEECQTLAQTGMRVQFLEQPGMRFANHTTLGSGVNLRRGTPWNKFKEGMRENRAPAGVGLKTPVHNQHRLGSHVSEPH